MEPRLYSSLVCMHASRHDISCLPFYTVFQKVTSEYKYTVGVTAIKYPCNRFSCQSFEVLKVSTKFTDLRRKLLN